MARVAARRKRFKSRAQRWFTLHGQSVTLGLIPPAVGPLGRDRDEVEGMLLYLFRQGHEEILRAAAAHYSEEVNDTLEALLSEDPLAIDKKAPKMPAFLHIETLPSLLLRSGARLGDKDLEAAVEMLALAPDGYPGLEILREACDSESLDTFVLALLEQWVLGGAPGRYDWMLRACVHLPSSKSTRTAPGNRQLPPIRGQTPPLGGAHRRLLGACSGSRVLR